MKQNYIIASSRNIHFFPDRFWATWEQEPHPFAFFFFKDFIFFPFSPQSPPVHSCIFFVVGPSDCGVWDAALAWFDEQSHVRAQDSKQRNTGPPAAECTNLTTRPRGQPPHPIALVSLT